LARSIARPIRDAAEGANRLAAGDLSQRLSETGPGEVGELTTSFNTMAESLEQGQAELRAQNEQLRESERVKSELVSIVSHGVRPPLRGRSAFPLAPAPPRLRRGAAPPLPGDHRPPAPPSRRARRGLPGRAPDGGGPLRAPVRAARRLRARSRPGRVVLGPE